MNYLNYIIRGLPVFILFSAGSHLAMMTIRPLTFGPSLFGYNTVGQNAKSHSEIVLDVILLR